MNREEWMVQAMCYIDEFVFNGILRDELIDFQIASGKCGGKKMFEVIIPDVENMEGHDFFPTTIIISHTVSDARKLLCIMTMAYMKAFSWTANDSKRFKKLRKRFFEKPYNECIPTDELNDIINTFIDKLGKFPGKMVYIPKKKKEKTINTYNVICPSCGYELQVKKKMTDKYGLCGPTCICGAKMTICTDEPEEGIEESENQDI